MVCAKLGCLDLVGSDVTLMSAVRLLALVPIWLVWGLSIDVLVPCLWPLGL